MNLTGSTDRNRKAVAYCRVSTLLNQDPQHQITAIRQFAQAREFELVHEYVDHGVSGVRERRPALDQLISDAKRGKFKVLIVAGIDRIGRHTRHLLNLLAELNAYGVVLISLRENIDFSTPMGRAALVILGAVAELERDLIRERIRVALASKKLAAQQCGSSWRCGRPGKVNNAELVAKVLELRKQGNSGREIGRILSGKIQRTTIRRIINNAERPIDRKPS